MKQSKQHFKKQTLNKINMKNLFENNGAEFSPCKRYRYCLWRIWDESKPKVMFIGLNPSTANENDNDPTIRRVIGFAKSWGYGGVYMMNCFPLVSTDPKLMMEFYETENHDDADMENMRWTLDIEKECKEIIFAWGNFNVAKERGSSISGYLKGKCLGKNKNGSPKHPLYIRSDAQRIEF